MNADLQHRRKPSENEVWKTTDEWLLLAPPCPKQPFPDFVLLLTTYQHKTTALLIHMAEIKVK